MNRDSLEESEKNHDPVVRETSFRFYEELNEHLPHGRRKRFFPFTFTGTPSVKNSIQAIGIPHGEVDLILVDGEPVDFSYQLRGGEKISVYPVFETLDISPVSRLRAAPLRDTKFVVDVNLGKLAQKLRLLGFDTLFRNDLEDDEIINLSLSEKRIILTRDKEILKHTVVTHGYWLRDHRPDRQLKEVVDRFQLSESFRPFTRCSACNGELSPVEKSTLEDLLPGDTLEYHQQFWRCDQCGKIYWRGSHFNQILPWIEELKKNL